MLSWLRANAAKHSIDPKRIAVWGSSAGGHLVAMLAVGGDEPELEGKVGQHLKVSSAVTCAVDYFGPTEFTEMNKFPSQIDHDSKDSPESKLVGGAIQKNRAASHAASPLKYISKADAPILIVHGSKDRLVPHNQSVIFHAALEKAKLDSTFITMTGGGHGFRSRELDARVEEFLAKHLLGKKDAKISDASIDVSAR
ncbi:MAG: prolyl oligopeptidase family serine peptidase [Planctomycetota bacterium]